MRYLTFGRNFERDSKKSALTSYKAPALQGAWNGVLAHQLAVEPAFMRFFSQSTC
jgi:hypothetical protein